MSDLLIDLNVGDCKEILAGYPDAYFDSCVTDGPYGLGFMGKSWDTFKPGAQPTGEREIDLSDHENPNVRGRTRSPAISPSQIQYDESLTGHRRFQEWTEEWAREVFRVLKPGAFLTSCGAPRSHHRMASGLEDAGFEIRDCLMWLFGQGFPKSLNLGEGRGTALKPAWEPIVLARKPLGKLTVAKCIEQYGTGALYIDECRVGDYQGGDAEARLGKKAYIEGNSTFGKAVGRWPANLILDEEAGAMLDAQTGSLKSGERKASHVRRSEKTRNTYGEWGGDGEPAYGEDIPASEGGASRFFYCPKVSKAEREFGCEHLPAQSAGEMTGGRKEGSAGLNNPRAGAGRGSGSHNAHPTVKPIALMRWLVKLVTPPGGMVLDPFCGSGSTGIAAVLEGHSFTGIDAEIEWITVSEARINAWRQKAA